MDVDGSHPQILSGASFTAELGVEASRVDAIEEPIARRPVSPVGAYEMTSKGRGGLVLGSALSGVSPYTHRPSLPGPAPIPHVNAELPIGMLIAETGVTAHPSPTALAKNNAAKATVAIRRMSFSAPGTRVPFDCLPEHRATPVPRVRTNPDSFAPNPVRNARWLPARSPDHGRASRTPEPQAA